MRESIMRSPCHPLWNLDAGGKCEQCFFQHTQECVEHSQGIIAAAEAYEHEWPKYCHSCMGVGGTHFPGTYYEPPGYDACQCVEDGRCPRCGKSRLEERAIDQYTTYMECPVCSWTDHPNEGTPGHPGWPACMCWIWPGAGADEPNWPDGPLSGEELRVQAREA